MIVRPFTFLTGMAFAFSGAYLFVVKHQSQSLEDRLGQLAQTSRADEQAIRVLKAQWALESDPSRIAALAAEFTQLKPMQPDQLVTLASLASSLPAPGSAAPYSNPEDMVPDMPADMAGSGGHGAPTPTGPAIEVRGHDVANATQAGAAASVAVADNQTPALDLPPPPPAAPAWHQAVHLAVVRHVSRSWIAPIPRQAGAHKDSSSVSLPLAAPLAVAPSDVIQTRALAAPVAPAQPLGAQIVRIKAEMHPVYPAPQRRNTTVQMPLSGGSLLGMAQSGSQN